MSEDEGDNCEIRDEVQPTTLPTSSTMSTKEERKQGKERTRSR